MSLDSELSTFPREVLKVKTGFCLFVLLLLLLILKWERKPLKWRKAITQNETKTWCFGNFSAYPDWKRWKDDGIRRFTVSNVYSGEKDKCVAEQAFAEEIKYVTNGSSARNLLETRNRDGIIQEKSVKDSLV